MPLPQVNQSPFERLAKSTSDSAARLEDASRMQVARGAKAKRTSTQTFNTSASLAAFQDVDFDTDGFWNVSNPSRLTVPPGLGGVYLIACSVGFFNETDVIVMLNTETINNNNQFGGEMSAVGFLVLKPGDYVVGHAQTEVGSVAVFPTLTMIKL